jgi:hypothetical protein
MCEPPTIHAIVDQVVQDVRCVHSSMRDFLLEYLMCCCASGASGITCTCC